jgi:hypothetical protein
MFDKLKKKIETTFPAFKSYGIGRKIRQDAIQGVVYVNELNVPCSVDNNFEGVFFFVRNSAEPDGDGFGNNSATRKRTNFTLIINSKKEVSARILDIVNSFAEWQSENFDDQEIAANFFSLAQADLRTYFYAITFVALETIDCKNCK